MPSVFYTGMALLRDGEVEDSQNYFKELSTHPENEWKAKGYLGLAHFFDRQNKPEAVENYLMKSVQFLESPEAFAKLSKTSLNLKKTDAAEKWAKKALELDSDNPKGIAAMAAVLLQKDQKKQALELTTKALKNAPNNCELLIQSAKINFSMGNYQTSKSNSSYAINLCPEEPDPYYFSGIIADRTYQKDEAKKMFKNFVKVGGDKTMVPEGY